MYYRINMQTIFLKIFVCKLVENHLSAILTNFFSVGAVFLTPGRAFQRFRGECFHFLLSEKFQPL